MVITFVFGILKLKLINIFCLVINYTLPNTYTDYVIRVGFAGRADYMGLVINLVSTVPEKV